MASFRRAFGLGIVNWLVPFVVALSISSIRDSWRSLFESIMPVTVVATTTILAILYVRRVPGNELGESIRLGLLWFLVSAAIDLPLMLSPPISMSVGEYAANIGLTYLAMPIVCVGLGYAFSRSRATPG